MVAERTCRNRAPDMTQVGGSQIPNAASGSTGRTSGRPDRCGRVQNVWKLTRIDRRQIGRTDRIGTRETSGADNRLDDLQQLVQPERFVQHGGLLQAGLARLDNRMSPIVSKACHQNQIRRFLSSDFLNFE